MGFFSTVSEGIQELGQQMIDNPNDWVQGQYHFINISNSDIKIWTANGAMFLKFEGNDGMNSSEKRYLNKCIKKSISNRINLAIKKL